MPRSNTRESGARNRRFRERVQISFFRAEGKTLGATKSIAAGTPPPPAISLQTVRRSAAALLPIAAPVRDEAAWGGVPYAASCNPDGPGHASFR